MQLLIAKGLLLLLFQTLALAGVTPAGIPGGGAGHPATQPKHSRAAQDPGPGLPGLSLPSPIPGPATNPHLGCTYCGSSDGSPALVSLRIRGCQASSDYELIASSLIALLIVSRLGAREFVSKLKTVRLFSTVLGIPGVW